MPKLPTAEQQLIAQLDELGQDDLQAVLGELASGLFASGSGSRLQLTWPDAVTDRAGAEDAQPPVDEAAAAEIKMRAAELRYGTLIEQIPAITFFAMLGTKKTKSM